MLTFSRKADFKSAADQTAAASALEDSGAACVTRTRDPRITNAMLYRLS